MNIPPPPPRRRATAISPTTLSSLERHALKRENKDERWIVDTIGSTDRQEYVHWRNLQRQDRFGR